MDLFKPRCKHRHTKEEHPQCFPRETKSGAKEPRILILDIETAPMEVFTWSLKDNNYISPANVIKDYFILCWSAKWLFDKDTLSDVVSSKEAIRRDDARIMKSMWLLLNEADIVVAHNGKAFDIKKLNSRFLLNQMPPPVPYEVVDTLTVARGIFGFSSNALTYLNKILGLNVKTETGGLSLWKACIEGDSKALSAMEIYNRNDVNILEELYLVLRPWIKTHPNMSMYSELDSTTCRNCGGTSLKSLGFRDRPTGTYEYFRCKCGAVVRTRQNAQTKEQRKNVTV